MSEPARRERFAVRPLTLADLPGCLALSQSAHWNQNAADWTLMLNIGQGWGIEQPDPAGSRSALLVGSIIALPFERGTAGDFAWLSMVLVLPPFGGRGYARLLLETAVGWLRQRALPVILDATPQGLPVYTRIGMQPHWSFRRYRREAQPPAGGRTCASRLVTADDWPLVLAADRSAFGADRQAILRDLASRQPGLARILIDAAGLRGYVLGREGREAMQIGPLWARDSAAATMLLTDAVQQTAGPVYLDLADAHADQLPVLQRAGFVEQRPFTRMTLDTARPPGDPTHLVLMAGPELG